jgi:LacI family transcriptional regulator
MPKVTIDDVAELAGVSIKTVSRVVNQEPNVREATRAKVDAAIAKLNYQPNKAARNLASHHSHIIGLIYDDPSYYEIPSAGYVIRMQQGVLSACHTSNYELLIHPCQYRKKDIGNEIKTLIEQVRPDGIVLAAPLSNMPKIVRAIEATGTPLVRLSPGTANGKQLSVVTNDREISAEMTRYLASLGHTRIAFITGHPSHKAVGNRYLGYRDGGSGEECAMQLLKTGNRPTAIFAANDDMAAGVIRVADRLGIKVPDELSVAGFDDIALARQVYPALTTINQPLSAMAEHAAVALIASVRGKRTLLGTEIVPAALQIRESTGPAPD